MNVLLRPSDTRPARIAALARLPVFLVLDGRRAIVAGNSAAASWKAELLSASGARVEVFAPEPGEELLALAADPPRGPIMLLMRQVADADFTGAAIAVGAIEGADAAARFAAAARHAGVPVNVIDKPAISDFSFGAIVNRSPLVIGISTAGAAPVFARTIRARIEAALPQGLARWAAAAMRWRPIVRSLDMDRDGRCSFWERFSLRALRYPDHEPDSDEFAELARGRRVNGGSIALVDAGSGDAELLTLRAIRMMQSADIILFDEFVGAGILDFARREAKKALIRAECLAPNLQDRAIATVIALAKTGKRVVQLRGGNPASSARTDKEFLAFGAAGIAVEIVPGVDPSPSPVGALSKAGEFPVDWQRQRKLCELNDRSQAVRLIT